MKGLLSFQLEFCAAMLQEGVKMDRDFQDVILDGLTQSIERNIPVTIRSNINKGVIVITATDNEIIVSISKLPFLINDIVSIISDAMDIKPDMIYDRPSMIMGEFRVYYAVWFKNNDEAYDFISKEYSLPENNITFLSKKALSVIQSIN